MSEPTRKPTRKMSAVGITGFLTTIIIKISHDGFGYTIDAELAAAITGILAFVAGYFTPNETPQDPPESDSAKAADTVIESIKKDRGEP
jgi:hypothetical protein